MVLRPLAKIPGAATRLLNKWQVAIGFLIVVIFAFPFVDSLLGFLLNQSVRGFISQMGFWSKLQLFLGELSFTVTLAMVDLDFVVPQVLMASTGIGIFLIMMALI